jgi:hypothetical protein
MFVRSILVRAAVFGAACAFNNISSGRAWCPVELAQGVHVSLRKLTSVRVSDTRVPLKTGAANRLRHRRGMQGNATMRLLDTGIRAFTHAQGTGVRWLKEELASLNVRTPLSEGSLEELARAADTAAWGVLDGSEGGSYLAELRQQLRSQATLVQRWTGTDEKMGDASHVQEFVRIARKYALPRPWKLSDPETRSVA